MAAGRRVLVSREAQASVPVVSAGTQCADPIRFVSSSASQTDDRSPGLDGNLDYLSVWLSLPGAEPDACSLDASSEIRPESLALHDGGKSMVDALEEHHSWASGGTHTNVLALEAEEGSRCISLPPDAVAALSAQAQALLAQPSAETPRPLFGDLCNSCFSPWSPIGDAGEEGVWWSEAFHVGAPQDGTDSTGDTASELGGDSHSCSCNPSDNREPAAMATGGKLGGVRACLKCNSMEANLAGQEGSQAVDVSYVCGGCHKHFTSPEKPPSCFQAQMGGRPYSCLLCPGCFSRLGGLYLDAGALALLKMNLGAARKTCSIPSCAKCFASEQDLCHHQRKHTGVEPHTGEKPHTPNVCQDGFVQKDALLPRDRTHSGDSPHVCGTCHKGFVCERTLRLHSCKPTTLEAAQCKVSQKFFTSQAKLEPHRSTRTASKSLSCRSCSRSFSSKRCLRRHLKTHNGEKPYTCTICTKTFARKYTLSLHEKRHSGGSPHVCGTCNQSFACERTLQLHNCQPSGGEFFQCKVCELYFPTKAEHDSHMIFHAADRSFSCKSCSKQFSSKQCLRRHLRTHNVERPYACSVCPKRFSLKQTLCAHEKTHGGSPYVCSVCSKGFTSKRNMLTHESKHASHRCNVCKEAFPVRAELAVHMALHAAEKPYSCSRCLKRFSTRITALRHENEHTMAKNHTCSACGMSFLYRHNLTLHEKTHEAEKPHKCSVCQKGFLRKDRLLAHEKGHTSQV